MRYAANFTYTTMRNVLRCEKKAYHFRNIVNCAFSSVWFYEKHIQNLEVKQEKRF